MSRRIVVVVNVLGWDYVPTCSHNEPIVHPPHDIWIWIATVKCWQQWRNYGVAWVAKFQRPWEDRGSLGAKTFLPNIII